MLQDNIQENIQQYPDNVLLQNKRAQLEQLKNLLALAISTGDIDALQDLSALVTQLQPESNAVQEHEPPSPKDKQAKLQELFALEQKQSEMMKAAMEQSNALNMKRKEISGLYDKLNFLKKSGPFDNERLDLKNEENAKNEEEAGEEEDVETDVTVIPFELQKNVSDSTLLPNSNQEMEDDQEELKELNENLNRLKAQEEELNYLRQHLETLQNIKANLELQASVGSLEPLAPLEEVQEQVVKEEEVTQTQTQEEAEIPEDLMLQALLNRLMAASVKEQEQEPESAQLENETSHRLDESIQQANAHVKDLEWAFEAAQDPKEKEIYKDLLLKLKLQLNELNQEKLILFKMLEQQEAKDTFQDTINVAEQDEVKEKDAVQQIQIEKAQVETVPIVSKPPPIPPMRSSSYSPLTVLKTSRPTSRVASRSTNRPGSVLGLFEKSKDEIYRSAANLISNFESEPYFLLSVFKKLGKLDSSYLRQKMLMNLDELLEEMEEADDIQENGETLSILEQGQGVQVKKEEEELITRMQVEDLIRTRVSMFLSDLLHESQDLIINKTVVTQLIQLVLGILHSSLYALMDQCLKMEEVEAKEETLSFLLFELSTNLEKNLNPFIGTQFALLQCELLRVVLDLTRDVLNRFESLDNVLIRWEEFQSQK